MLEPLFLKVAGLRLATLLKKRAQHRCFPLNFVKFLRTPILLEQLWWLTASEEEHEGKREIIENTDKSIQKVKRLYKKNNKITHDFMQTLKRMLTTFFTRM